MTVPANPRPSMFRFAHSRIVPGLFVLGIITGGWYVVQAVTATPAEKAGDDEHVKAVTTETELRLPTAKIAKAKFTTEPSAVRKIEDVRTLSGRLTYDEARHIEIKAPVSGVLIDVLVKPGDVVGEGQLLAVVNSPEIGNSRAAILSEQAKHDVILKQQIRLNEVTANLGILFVLLDKNTPLHDIERQFNDKALGTYRRQIMATYSERFLANQLVTAARQLLADGTVPHRTMQERENSLHVADANFRSVRETTAYDIGVQKRQLEAARSDATRQVMIAQNHLTTLLGFEDEAVTEVTSASLSRLEVRAPFAGTIESRTYATRERVSQSDSLFVLANTESLYVSADIRENEWAAMSVQPGQEISVTAPAIPGRAFSAKVHYIGREVAIESNSLPLIGTIANDDGLLRPGMFVRVSIPVAESDSVVAVRTEAVMQHENEKFVFVSIDDQTFRKVDVRTGVSNEEWVEIKDGLKPGERVIAGGAFLLKSELLLAGEED